MHRRKGNNLFFGLLGVGVGVLAWVAMEQPFPSSTSPSAFREFTLDGYGRFVEGAGTKLTFVPAFVDLIPGKHVRIPLRKNAWTPWFKMTWGVTRTHAIPSGWVEYESWLDDGRTVVERVDRADLDKVMPVAPSRTFRMRGEPGTCTIYVD